MIILLIIISYIFYYLWLMGNCIMLAVYSLDWEECQCLFLTWTVLGKHILTDKGHIQYSCQKWQNIDSPAVVKKGDIEGCKTARFYMNPKVAHFLARVTECLSARVRNKRIFWYQEKMQIILNLWQFA